MQKKDIIEFSSQDYKQPLEEQSDFYMQFVTFSKESERKFLNIVTRILAKIDKLYLKDPIITILKEFITNAVKANMKRHYFLKRKLTITEKQDYIKGMEDFKKDCLYEDSPALEELLATEYRVKALFKLENSAPEILIINNIPMVKEETDKINARISKAYRYNDITDAFSDVLDDSEGAGLGLIMALMVFKNSGFAKDDFIVSSDESKTVLGIRLSETEDGSKRKNIIADEILHEIKYLPSFPDRITHLQQMCDSAEASISEISTFVKRDPALATSILKKANSAGYLTSYRATSIEDAIKKIGLHGLKTLALATGIDNIVEEKYSRYKSIWETSYKMAFYAYKLATKYKNSKLAETAYLSALISKIGEIALLSVKKDAIEKIKEIAGRKNMAAVDMLEEITLGVSYPTLSALITKKWNFDEQLTQTIQYHTRPHLAPAEIQELVYVVYVAHYFTQIEQRKIRMQSAYFGALEYFSLHDEDEFTALHKELQEAYDTKES